MKKLSLGLLLLIVLALLVSPFVMGIMTQQSLTHYVEHINQQSPAIKITIKSYEKGWFSSRAQLDMVVKLKNHDSGMVSDFNFTFDKKIHHGPILISHNYKLARAYVESNFSLDEKTGRMLGSSAIFEPSYPLIKSNILLGIDGSINTAFNVPVFKAINKKDSNESLAWQGLDGNTTIESDFKKTQGDLHLVGLELISKDVSLSMGHLKANYKLHESENGLWSGAVNITQNDIVAKNKENEHFELNKFNLGAATSIVNNYLSYKLNFDLNKMVAEDKQYGPFLIDFEIKNLDAKVVSNLQKNVEKANNPNLSENEKQMILMAMLPSLPTMITSMTELTVDAKLDLPQGKLESNGFIRLNQNGASKDTVNLLTLRNQLLASLDAKIPANLIHVFTKHNALEQLKYEHAKENQPSHTQNHEQNKPLTETSDDFDAEAEKMASTKIAAWESAGMLKRLDNYYVVKLWLEDGHLKVNGNVIN